MAHWSVRVRRATNTCGPCDKSRDAGRSKCKATSLTPSPSKPTRESRSSTLHKAGSGLFKTTGHGGDKCDDFVGYVYGYVGLAVSGGGNAVDDLYNSTDTTVQDAQQGSIAFYHLPTDGVTTWRHAAVNVAGGQIVDQNCGLPHALYPTYTDAFGNLQTDNDHPPTVNQHSGMDSELVKPSKYAAPSNHTTAEVRQLDNE